MPKGKILMGKRPKPGPVKPTPAWKKRQQLASNRKIEDNSQKGFGAEPGGETQMQKPKKSATTTARRPQLDKMGPGEGTSKGKYTSTYSAVDPKIGVYTFKKIKNYTVSGKEADKRNAEYAYQNNPANIDRNKRKGRVTMTSGSVDRTSYFGDRNQTYKRSGGK